MAESLGFTFELTDFSGEAPIFPLPDVVFFPKTLLPLHIFEPRYRQMIRDVLAGERLVAITLLQEGWEHHQEQESPFHSIGTLAYIEEVEPLEDGKSNILLNGLVKVHITELPKTAPYRHGAMRIIQDTAERWQINQERERLLQRFRRIAELAWENFPIRDIEQADMSLETLVNLMATWLPIPLNEKQKLLEIDNIVLRSEIVREFLRQEMDDLSLLNTLHLPTPDNPHWN